MIPLWRRTAEAGAAGAFALCGAATLLIAVMAAYSGAVGAPYWDQWVFTDPSEYLSRLLDRHNEHPILLGRILFAIDYAAFDAQGWFLQLVTFALLGAQTAAFGFLAFLAGMRRWSAIVAAVGAAATLSFVPHAWENLIWGFQPVFVGAFALTVVAAAALAGFAESGRRRLLALSFAAAGIAPICLANGVLAPFMLALVALRLGRRRLAAGYAGLGMLAAVLLAASPGGTAPSASLGAGDLPALLTYVFRFVGNAPADVAAYLDKVWWRAGLDGLTVSFWSGLSIVAASAALALRAMFHAERAPARLALAAIIVFVGATAAATAIGRIDFPPDQALSSRYNSAVAPLLIATGLLAWIEIKARLARGAAALVAAVLAWSIPISSVPLLVDLIGQQRARLAGQTALVVGARDLESIGALAFDSDLAFGQSAKLRAAAKWHFADPWARRVGDVVAAPERPRRTCAGRMEVAPAPADGGYLRVSGGVDREALALGRTLAILDAAGRVVGYGRVWRRPADILDLPGPNDGEREWIGHVATDRVTPPLQAFQAKGADLTCALGPAVSPPSAAAG